MFNTMKVLLEDKFEVQFFENNNNRFIYSSNKDLTEAHLLKINEQIKGFNCYFERTNPRMAILNAASVVVV